MNQLSLREETSIVGGTLTNYATNSLISIKNAVALTSLEESTPRGRHNHNEPKT